MQFYPVHVGTVEYCLLYLIYTVCVLINVYMWINVKYVETKQTNNKYIHHKKWLWY